MPTFQYPVMARGLARGVDAFTQNFLAMQKLRQGQAAQMAQQGYLERGLAMREASAAREEAEAQRISAARAAVPGNIARLTALVPGTSEMPAIAEQGMPYDPSGAAYTPAVPGVAATPARAPRFSEMLGDPERLMAAQQLQAAGMPAFDIAARVDQARRQDEVDQRNNEGLALYRKAGLKMMSDDPVTRREGFHMALYAARVTGGIERGFDVLKLYKTERDTELNDAFYAATGKWLGPVLQGELLPPKENVKLAGALQTARGPAATAVKDKLMERMFVNAATTFGAGHPALRAYFALRQVQEAAPEGPPTAPKPRETALETWRNKVEADPVLGMYATLARKEGTLPPEVQRLEKEEEAAKALARKREEAEAGQPTALKKEREARAKLLEERAKDVGKGKKETAIEAKARLREEAEEQLKAYQRGEGPELSVTEINSLHKQAGIKELGAEVELPMIQFRAARKRAKGGAAPAKPPGGPTQAGMTGGARASVTAADAVAKEVRRLNPQYGPQMPEPQRRALVEQAKRNLGVQ